MGNAVDYRMPLIWYLMPSVMKTMFSKLTNCRGLFTLNFSQGKNVSKLDSQEHFLKPQISINFKVGPLTSGPVVLEFHTG